MQHDYSAATETSTNMLCKNQIVNWAVGRVRFKRADTVLFQYQSDHASVWSVFDWKPASGGEGDGEGYVTDCCVNIE